MNIATSVDLGAFIQKLLQTKGSQYEHSLESYLRSLYTNVLLHENNLMSYSLLGELLEASFDTLPSDYDEHWNRYNRPPSPDTAANGFMYAKEVLLFQIYDLREMERQEQENKYRFLGTISRTNHTWYNFDIFSYLECGASGLEDHLGEVTQCDWFTFGKFLELGRLYE
ncbi:hypothetical protein [Paenibacillus sp. UNC451MF]|uniref:hypothetical protein n=1 Tax=Paenibacillus sp. UNC451MF TaxID=1449063 RepID=UPI00068D5D18|nr:hypothetical protein [Paenibacillus sp. UNC451MF]